MSGLSDFVDYSYKSTLGRAKDFLKNSTDPKKAIKSGLRGQVGKDGIFDFKRDKQFFEEDMDRLFVGEPVEPLAPEAAEPTLKSAESRSPSQNLSRRRKAASLYGNEPLAKKAMLGG
jgi:hypothetical protein